MADETMRAPETGPAASPTLLSLEDAIQRAQRRVAAIEETMILERVEEILGHYPHLMIKALLRYIGEDPNREGLKDTPGRVLKAWKEWGAGYNTVDVAALLKTFVDGAERVDEMIVVHNIPVVSKCEHHLADISGFAHVGYIPDGKIVGLSKLPRVVDLFARRLQVQERLTRQIADAIEETLAPKGVAVTIMASHACMSSRGVKIHGSVTSTSAMRGVLLTKPEARAEFLQFCAQAERQR